GHHTHHPAAVTQGTLQRLQGDTRSNRDDQLLTVHDWRDFLQDHGHDLRLHRQDHHGALLYGVFIICGGRDAIRRLHIGTTLWHHIRGDDLLGCDAETTDEPLNQSLSHVPPANKGKAHLFEHRSLLHLSHAAR